MTTTSSDLAEQTAATNQSTCGTDRSREAASSVLNTSSDVGSSPALSSTDRERPIRVLLAKPGLDGHDQGAKVVVQALKAVGFDVTYTGLRQTPEAVTTAALKTGADVIALSSMAGSHLAFCAKLKPLLEEAGLANKVWMIGGNIPRQDHDALRAMGFSGVFQTGSKLVEITAFVENAVRQSAASSTEQAS